MRARLLACVLLCSAGLASCGSGAPPYAVCVDDLDCSAPSDACYALRFTRSDGTDAEGAFCSATCARDEDCPEDGVCVALEGDPSERFFCAARCASAMDCYAGLACTEVEGAAAMRLCLP